MPLYRYLCHAIEWRGVVVVCCVRVRFMKNGSCSGCGWMSGRQVYCICPSQRTWCTGSCQLCGCVKTYFQWVFRQWCTLQSTTNRCQNCSRKMLFTDQDHSGLSCIVTAICFATRQEVLQTVNVVPQQAISEHTQSRELHAMDTWSIVPCKPVFAGLQWVQSHRHYTFNT